MQYSISRLILDILLYQCYYLNSKIEVLHHIKVQQLQLHTFADVEDSKISASSICSSLTDSIVTYCRTPLILSFVLPFLDLSFCLESTTFSSVGACIFSSEGFVSNVSGF